ncbi:MAG TPA: hypothetical protein VIM61_00590 [Chthoniobacterales bacterium]
MNSLIRLILNWRAARLVRQARQRRRDLARAVRHEQFEISRLERDARRLQKLAGLHATPRPAKSIEPRGLGALITGAPFTLNSARSHGA